MLTTQNTITGGPEHKRYSLSEELYVITSDDHPAPDYKTGAVVRLIAPYKKGPIGGHFSREYLTTCKVGAKEAEFCGIHRKSLKFLARIEDGQTESNLKTFIPPSWEPHAWNEPKHESIPIRNDGPINDYLY